MPFSFPKALTPRSFYGRAVLILIVPIIVIQIVLSVVFIQRHYERVTAQLTQNTLAVVGRALEQIGKGPEGLAYAQDLLSALRITVSPGTAIIPDGVPEPRDWLDLAGREVVSVLQQQLAGYIWADLVAQPSQVLVWVDSEIGPLKLTIPRRLVSASNPHQLLVIVFLASILMVGIAFQFLRLQVRPIRRLGEAAEAYGRGEFVPLKSSGAREIRAASLAFIDMRNRIERQNVQRKIMLSGISHDMRTPLTRMRLILSMMREDDDSAALRTEIADLERLLDSFLDYSRGQGAPVMAPVDLIRLVSDLVARYRTSGDTVDCVLPDRGVPDMLLDRGLIERALDNLLSNARRYGTKMSISVHTGERSVDLVVEDNGPGIAPRDRARATEPFVRLDEARNQDAGGGVGLGLAIVTEAARAHNGTFTLDESEALSGLRATLRLPRVVDHSA